jgi:hypothetical protein
MIGRVPRGEGKMMPRGYALGAAAAIVALSLVATASAMTPKQLYGKLMTMSYTPLPSGSYSAKVGTASLDNRMRRHHAVGAVQVTIDSESAVYYIVFSSRSDALAYNRDRNYDDDPDLKVIRRTEMGKAPGYKKAVSFWRNYTVEGENAFGKRVRNGLTMMGVVTKNVAVGAATVSTDNEDSGDVPATIKLLGSGMKHLAKVRG